LHVEQEGKLFSPAVGQPDFPLREGKVDGVDGFVGGVTHISFQLAPLIKCTQRGVNVRMIDAAGYFDKLRASHD